MKDTEICPVSPEEFLHEPDFDLAPSESAFFSQLEKSLKTHFAPPDAPNPLEALYGNFLRLSRLFISFEHPWVHNSGILQKACAWYLANGRPDKEESRRLIEMLRGFTISACRLSENNELVHHTE